MNLDDEWSFFQKNKINIILAIIIGLVIIIGIYQKDDSIFSFAANNETTQNKTPDVKQKELDTTGAKSTKKLIVEIEGAVKNPGVYSLEEGSRIDDLVKASDGFTENVDYYYTIRNLNRAEKLADGSKIYIKSKDESLDNSQNLNQSSSNLSSDLNTTSKPTNGLININSSSNKELESLPGIGEVTANNIIKNRPYERIEELVEKKIMTSSKFENIKDLIDL